MEKVISILIFAGFLLTGTAQDDIRELARAKEAYQSQVKFAKQTYVQKVEKIRKTSGQDGESPELNAAKTAYVAQVKFAEQSYLQKLEGLTKTAGRTRGQIEAIKSEISNFKGQMGADEVVPAVEEDVKSEPADARKNPVKTADHSKENAKPLKDPFATDTGEDDVNNAKETVASKNEKPRNKPESDDVSGIGVPGEKYTDVQRNALDDDKDSSKVDAEHLDVDDLSADWLKEHRQFASGRPHPENYEFSPDAFKTYVAGIPEDKREMEEKRYRQLSGIKNYLVRLMERNTYDKPVNLKDGSTAARGIMMNPNYISVKSSGRKFRRVGWDSLPVDQAAEILSYFADFRLRASAGPGVTPAQKKAEAAEDCIRIGILCDWYGEYELSVKYARKAISIEPKAEGMVKKFIMQ